MSDREHEPMPATPRRAPRDVRPHAVSGEILPAPLAADMAARFGAGFGDVRVRTDAAADAQARSESAQAFTRGDEITFAAGRYDPVSSSGRELLAHELAHVVQQRRGGGSADAESRADRAAADVTAGRPVNANTLGGAPVGVQAKPGDAPATDTANPATEAPVSGSRRFVRVLDRFALDKDTLTADHRKTIDELAFSISLHVGMLARGKARIEIVGHADTTGKDEHNDKLGQDRADRVKEALEKKLAPGEDQKPPTLDWSVRSAGEQELLIPTPDKTLEPRNRAVEVRVTIESMPAPTPPAAAPTLDPRKYDFPDITKPPPSGPGSPQEDIWKKMEENQRKIEEYDRKHPRKPKSLQDVVVEGVMDTVVDPILKKVPLSKSKKDWLRGKIRGGIEAGTEKACEAAIDAAGVAGEEANALKAACKAAIQAKEGGKP
jgi:outer membrane protein OmpA-like peptidoglycan-associated protein